MTKSKLVFSILLQGLASMLLAQIEISTENANHVYSAGEEMNFILSSESLAQVTYKIIFDTRTAVIETGEVTVMPGEDTYIPFTLNEPGTVVFEANDGLNVPQKMGIAFSPFAIGIYETCPTDFDDFWSDQKSQLGTIPIDADLEIYETGDSNITYRVNLATVDNRRVYGYITIPNGTGPFPAILTLPPNGSTANIAGSEEVISELVGAISMSISIHNSEPDEIDPNAYLPNNTDVREEYYYRTSILAGVRAIDYIFSRADFDGQNMVVTGNSQGGGLAICVAGIDPRVQALTISNPALCEHAAYKYDRASGFPYYNWAAAQAVVENIDIDVLEASKYYDAKYFAQRIDRPCLFTTGYQDLICPTTTVFGATNELRGPKVVVHALALGHNAPVEYWSGRLNFFVRHLPAFAQSLFSMNMSKGYLADAGSDKLGNSNQAITIVGITMDNNTTNNTWPVRWDLVEGPGKAKFAQADQRNTTVTFDQPGTYVLRFSATDAQRAITDDIVISCQDFMKIIVQ